jgi:hypothetical protein
MADVTSRMKGSFLQIYGVELKENWLSACINYIQSSDPLTLSSSEAAFLAIIYDQFLYSKLKHSCVSKLNISIMNDKVGKLKNDVILELIDFINVASSLSSQIEQLEDGEKRSRFIFQDETENNENHGDHENHENSENNNISNTAMASTTANRHDEKKQSLAGSRMLKLSLSDGDSVYYAIELENILGLDYIPQYGLKASRDTRYKNNSTNIYFHGVRCL